MAVTKTTQAALLGRGTWVYDSDADGTAETDVMGGATRVRTIIADNSDNAANSYLKLWDAKTVTVGTTAPDFIFELPPNQACFFDMEEDSTGSVRFTSALSYAVVTTSGTAGSTNPTSNVLVWIFVPDA